MKKIFFVFIFLLTFLLAAAPSYAEKFYIKDYKVLINVNEDASFKVNEEIYPYFTENAHGIVRDIGKNNIIITSATAQNLHSKENNPSSLSLILGDPDSYVKGDTRYDISFKARPKAIKNEFYYNIIGTEWNTKIENASFRIVMPKNIDSDKVGVSIGKYGTKGFTDGAVFNVKDNMVTGKILQPLNPNEGITVRIELPDNYYKKTVNSYLYCLVLIIFILTSFVYSVWHKFGKESHVTPIVTFDAPKGVSPIDAEFIYKGYAGEKGFIATIIELAGKKFIKIVQDKKTSFTLIKEENENENENENQTTKQEEKVLNILFNKKNEVTKEELEISPTFYTKVQNYTSDLTNMKKRQYEEKPVNIFIKLLLCLCTLTIFLIACNSMSAFALKDITSVITTFGIYVLLAAMNRKMLKNPLSLLIFVIIFCVIFCINFNFKETPVDNIVIFTLGIIATIVCAVCLIELPKRNNLANKILGELLGLKHFIETAEKNRLEKMVEDNPSYFYNILPYAYILDVSDVWIKQFEDIMKEQPEFYSHYYPTVGLFNNFTDSMQKCSIPTYENGGIQHTSSSGRGGFSGGGSGGGGGHSW